MRRALGNIIAAFALCLSATAAAGETPTLLYTAEHTNTRDVRDIARFAGRIWVATAGGLSVHDGKDGRFLFALSSIHGLPGNSVNGLAKSSSGTLLAAGDFGLAEISASCESASRDCFARTTALSAKAFDPIVDIIEGDFETLALGHQSGLRSADAERPAKLAGGMWRAMARGKDGILVGGMDGRVTLQRDLASRASQILALDAPVLDAAAVEEGFLVVSGRELVLIENGRIRPILFGSCPVTATALSQGDRSVLVGTSEGEIFEYESGELSLLGKIDGRIEALAGDGEAIWLGIARTGLVRFDRKARSAGSSLSRKGEICSNHVTRITSFGGRLIAGTFDNGACVYEGGAWRMLEGMEGQYVHGVASDGASLWVATSNGLARFDEALVPVPIGDGDPKELRWFASSAVTALAETKDGIAVGSPWGVVRVARKGESLRADFISRFKGAPEHLTAIAASPSGLLIASETDGVRFVGRKRKDTRAYLDPVHLEEAWVLDVSPDGAGFWAATCQSGASHFDGTSAVFIDEARGLADRRTVGVAAFGRGAFIATLGGLSYADSSGRARAPFEGSLPDPRGSMVSVLRSTLYFATESGMAAFEISK